MKPKVFIGSSRERLDIAYAVKANLDSIVEATVWTQGFLELTSSVLDNLIATLNESDFGIFIFWPEDIVKIREEEYLSARDNVVFELGLFIGGLGKTRTFFILPRDYKNLHLPSDLSGIIPATIDTNRIDETLQRACSLIKQSILKMGIRKSRFERSDVIQINKPKILCAASAQYAQFEFEKDVKILEDAFPDQVTVVKNLSSEHLRALLRENHFDIVHINSRVELWSGELILSDIDFKTEKPLSPEPDKVKSETFLRLIESSKTHLVVLATWGAIGLATKLARATNVISQHDPWSGEKNNLKALIKWEKYFYKALSEGDPLSVAFNDANEDAEASMVLIMKKDVVFAR